MSKRDTSQISIVVRIYTSSSIVFNVSRQRTFPELQFAGNFPVSTLYTFAVVIHIYKEKRTTPFVWFKHLNSCRCSRSAIQIIVQGATKIMVKLNILCLSTKGN